MIEQSEAAMQENMVREAARYYLSRGYAVIPLPPRVKEPNIARWPELRLTMDDLHFFLPNGNIGLLTGEPSGGLVDVDIDCSEAMVIASALLPLTEMRGGRPGKPFSHYWYIVDPPNVRRKEFSYKLKHDDALRCNAR